jgi:N-acetyl-gamma-glutamyl-phosphate reductase
MREVTIVGVSGYGGGELVRLLSRHPDVKIIQALGDTHAGQPLSRAFAGLHGSDVGKLVCEPKTTPVRGEIVFLAQDNGYSSGVAGKLLDEGRTVIDLAADFRLIDPDAWVNFYKLPVPEEKIREKSVYGLPERHREKIQGAKLIANPGCNATAAILALAPLVEAGVIEKSPVIVDVKAAVSGAGRAKSDAMYRFSERNESVVPYNVGGVHRHIAEITQEAGVTPTFVPHLIPMSRGIVATCYAPLREGSSLEMLYEAWRSAYGSEKFVIIREPGDWPTTKDTLGSNYCHLSATVDPETGLAVLISVLDNLGKGASGAAVQNMNVALGFEEWAGLEGAGIWP